MVAVILAIELLLMTCIGIFAAKIKIINDTFSSQLTSFLMKIALPCLIITSITATEFSIETAKRCMIAIFAGAIVVGLSLLIGQLFLVAFGKGGTGRIIRYGLTFTHFSFMGIPIVDALFGETGNLYYVMFLVPVRILYYLLTPQLLGQPEKKSGVEMIKNILNPCLVSVVIGIIIWIFNIALPEPVMYCLNSLTKICSPLGLILCGLVIGKYDLKKLLNLRYLRLPFFRTLLMPFIFLVITRLFLRLGMDSMLCSMIVIYSALPCASLTAVFAMRYEKDPEVQFEAAGSVFFATLISTITIPIWYVLLGHL